MFTQETLTPSEQVQGCCSKYSCWRPEWDVLQSKVRMAKWHCEWVQITRSHSRKNPGNVLWHHHLFSSHHAEPLRSMASVWLKETKMWRWRILDGRVTLWTAMPSALMGLCVWGPGQNEVWVVRLYGRDPQTWPWPAQQGSHGKNGTGYCHLQDNLMAWKRMCAFIWCPPGWQAPGEAHFSRTVMISLDLWLMTFTESPTCELLVQRQDPQRVPCVGLLLCDDKLLRWFEPELFHTYSFQSEFSEFLSSIFYCARNGPGMTLFLNEVVALHHQRAMWNACLATLQCLKFQVQSPCHLVLSLGLWPWNSVSGLERNISTASEDVTLPLPFPSKWSPVEI
jgi:hypothetical protein